MKKRALMDGSSGLFWALFHSTGTLSKVHLVILLGGLPLTLFKSSGGDESGSAFNPSRLRVARRRRGLTKIQLAATVGVEWRSVSGYESGEYPPSADTLERLASTLKFPIIFFY